MYQIKNIDDTIAAIATPPGQGGIGIIRMSGPQAIEIIAQIFKSKSGKSVADAKTFTAHYGWIINGHDTVDEVLVTLMRAPKSYTTQDVVEISAHASSAVIRSILDLVISKGARLAEPGEFTKRAFLNGRIDLAQAEAVMDLISAKTGTFARIATHQLKGDLSKELDAIRDELMNLYTAIEAVINFPEDDIDAQGRAQMALQIQQQINRVQKLLDTSHNGRILKDGIRIVLCGKPNAGKSSLLNVLLKQDRAIVTDIAGTTRDVIEESAQIKGVPLQLIDTAGILEPRDLIEQEAIKRSHLFIDSADLVLLVLDASRPLDESDQILLEKLKGRQVLYVLNKTDLPQVIDEQSLPNGKHVKISALMKSSIEELEQAIVSAVWQGEELNEHSIVISNVRHIASLTNARNDLKEVYQLISDKASWEFISQDIKDAVNALDAITGRNIDEDLIDRIFSNFCIGK